MEQGSSSQVFIHFKSRLQGIRIVVLLIPFLLVFRTGSGQTEKRSSVTRLNFSRFEPYLHRENDSLYVVNFWASWCVPCREELPSFEKIYEKYSGEKVKILLVSLDFPNQVESRLIPFIRTNNIKPEVILLDDPNQNEWIGKVDAKWSGALPFTQIYGKNFRDSYERSFHFNELDSIIKIKLKIP